MSELWPYCKRSCFSQFPCTRIYTEKNPEIFLREINTVKYHGWFLPRGSKANVNSRDIYYKKYVLVYLEYHWSSRAHTFFYTHTHITPPSCFFKTLYQHMYHNSLQDSEVCNGWASLLTAHNVLCFQVNLTTAAYGFKLWDARMLIKNAGHILTSTVLQYTTLIVIGLR